MNKSFIWIVGVLLLLSFVSAELQTIGTKTSISPFGNKKIILESITDEKINKDSFMLSEKSLDLPVVRISKTFLWVETDKIAEYKIIRNDVSIVNAETYGKAVLYQDDKLFDDAEFKDLKGQLKEIVSFQYYIKQNISYIVQEPATYKTECVKTNSSNLTKGSLLETCYEVVDTYKDVTKYKEEWVKYNYETLKSGEYEWLLKGQRKANTKVDFIPKAQGLSLDEYVWWNEDWPYKRQINLTANVGNISYLATINYSDNMQSDFDDLRFVDCALETTEYNITRQAFVNATNSTWRIDTNGQSCVMMYYGNPTATSTSSPSNTYLNPVSYWTLDGDANDLLGVNNGTINGATYNSSGKIAGAYSFDGTNDYINLGDTYIGSGENKFSLTMWYNDAPTGMAYRGIFAKVKDTTNRFFVDAYGGGTGQILVFFGNSNYGEYAVSASSTYKFLTILYDGTQTGNANRLKLFINGSEITATRFGGTIPSSNQDVSSNAFLGRDTGSNYLIGQIDEVGIWNRSLTQDEITQLYTQTMPTYTVGNEIQGAGFAVINYVTPPTPENNSNLSVNYIPVEVDVNYTNAILKNITFDFYKGGVLNASYFYENETYFVNHTSCTCDNWAFNVTLCYLESISNTTNCVTTSTRNILIDILPPTINITSPLESYYYLSDNQSLDLNFTVEDNIAGVDSCWVEYNNNELLETFITTTNYNVSGQMAAKMNDVYYDITNYNNITINTSVCSEFCTSTTTYIYGNETVKIASAIGDFGYQYPVSIYKGLYNASINCSENTTFNYISNLDTLTLYANDTFGNVNSEVRSWWSKFYYNDTIFQTPVLEGISNNILTTFSSNQTLSGVYLIYGNETYTPTIYKNGNDYLLSTNVISPEITTDTNISIQGIITSNNVNYSLFNVSQEVLSINLSTNCSVGTYPVLNITNYDEETLSVINGTVELLFSLSNGGSVGTISSLFNNNTIRVCSNHNISSVNYLYSLQLRYYGSNYSYETYNILPTNTSRLPIFIPLYYMNKSIGTEFVINYKDYDYIEHPGAIIQVHRQYLTNDSYFITEIPLIDYQGQSTAMFNTNNIKYKLIIIENGKIIDYFDDIIPKCQSLVLGTCEINIRGVDDVDVTTDNTLSYNLNFTNQSIIITYIIPSGVPSTVTLETNQTSRFLSNVSSCNVSNFGSGGTLTCPYNMTVGDSIIHMIISVDGELYVEGDLYVTEDVNVWFFKNNYFIAFIIVLTLTLMFISDGAVLLIIDGLSIIFMSLIFLIRGFNFMTATSSIVWLLIAIIISIYKLSKKEDTS